jgi:hypothetical protein
MIRSSCFLGALALAVGCADLADPTETYCELHQGEGSCSGGTGGPWWCVDQASPPLPLPTQGKILAFVQPVLEWSTKAPLAGRGLSATLCGAPDSACANPLGNQQIREGMLGPNPFPEGVPTIAAGVLVPEGFDGFIKFDMPPPPNGTEADRFVTDAYYLGGEISGVSGPISTGGPILMLQKKLLTAVVKDTFRMEDAMATTVTDQNGTLAVSAYDCNGQPVPDARIEIKANGQTPTGVMPFQLPASRIPVAQPPGPLLTSQVGLAGYFNVPPGNVQILAFKDVDATEPFGTIQLGSVAGQITLAPIRPEYVRVADVRRPPDELIQMANSAQ